MVATEPTEPLVTLELLEPRDSMELLEPMEATEPRETLALLVLLEAMEATELLVMLVLLALRDRRETRDSLEPRVCPETVPVTASKDGKELRVLRDLAETRVSRVTRDGRVSRVSPAPMVTRETMVNSVTRETMVAREARESRVSLFLERMLLLVTWETREQWVTRVSLELLERPECRHSNAPMPMKSSGIRGSLSPKASQACSQASAADAMLPWRRLSKPRPMPVPSHHSLMLN
jgi:hypothetical protein